MGCEVNYCSADGLCSQCSASDTAWADAMDDYHGWPRRREFVPEDMWKREYVVEADRLGIPYPSKEYDEYRAKRKKQSNEFLQKILKNVEKQAIEMEKKREERKKAMELDLAKHFQKIKFC